MKVIGRNQTFTTDNRQVAVAAAEAAVEADAVAEADAEGDPL